MRDAAARRLPAFWTVVGTRSSPGEPARVWASMSVTRRSGPGASAAVATVSSAAASTRSL